MRWRVSIGAIAALQLGMLAAAQAQTGGGVPPGIGANPGPSGSGPMPITGFRSQPGQPTPAAASAAQPTMPAASPGLPASAVASTLPPAATVGDPTVGPGSRTDMIQRRTQAQLTQAPAAPAYPPPLQPAAARPPGQVPPIMDSPRGAPGARPPLETDLDAQMRGQYPPMFRERDPTVPLADLQGVWSDPTPAPGQVSPGILKVRYERDRTVAVRTRQYMTTAIHLPPCETIDQAYIGDRSVFRLVQPRDNVILLQPGLAGADTNVHVVTESGRSYTFYVRSEGTQSKWTPDLTVYVEAPFLCTSAVGPDQGPAFNRLGGSAATPAGYGSAGAGFARQAGSGDPVAARRADRRPGDFVRSIPFDVARLSCDSFKVYGATEADRAIAPLRVCEDGVFVYFDYGEQIDSVKLPVVHMMSDGIDQPINTRMSGDRRQILVAEAMSDIYTLRTGQRVLCVRRVHAMKTPPSPIEIDSNLGKKDGGLLGWLR